MPPASLTPVFLVTFASPARVMLMDKCTPLVAVTAEIVDSAQVTALPGPVIGANMIVRTKMLFPCNGGPVKANLTMLLNRDHLVSIVEVREP